MNNFKVDYVFIIIPSSQMRVCKFAKNIIHIKNNLEKNLPH